MKIPFLLFTIVLSLAGCQDLKDNTPGELSKLKDQVTELGSSVKDYVHSSNAPDEIKKLYQYEYKVLQYPIKNLPLIEEHLSELGKDRWDCFDTEKLITEGKEPTLLVFCKRKPETPLKYIPKTLIGS